MEPNPRELINRENIDRNLEAKREAMDYFVIRSTEILSDTSLTKEQRLSQVEDLKRMLESNISGLLLTYTSAYSAMRAGNTSAIARNPAAASLAVPAAIPQAAPIAAPANISASPHTNQLGVGGNIAQEAAASVRENEALRIRGERLRQTGRLAAIITGTAVAGAATSLAYTWAQNQMNTTTAAPATPPKAVAPAQPGSAAATVPQVNPAAPVLNVPPQPAVAPVAPQTQPAVVAAPAVPQAAPVTAQPAMDKYNLDSYDKLFGAIKNDIIAHPSIPKSFDGKSVSILSDSEMRVYEVELKKLYPNNNITVKGETYGYRGTAGECITFVSKLSREINNYGYKIDKSVVPFANIACYDDGRLVGIYNIDASPHNLAPGLATPAAIATPPAPQANTNVTTAPRVDVAPAPMQAPTTITQAPAAQTNPVIKDHDDLWRAIGTAINNNPSLPKKVQKLGNDQTNQLRAGLGSALGKNFTMGPNNYGYVLAQGEDLNGCKAFVDSVVKSLSQTYNLTGKIEDYAYMPCFAPDSNGKAGKLVGIYTLTSPSQALNISAAIAQNRNVGNMAQNYYQGSPINQIQVQPGSSQYAAQQNARSFYNWGNETYAKEQAARVRQAQIRAQQMNNFVINP